MSVYVNWNAIIREWSDQELLTALNDPLYQELGTGDVSVAQLAARELYRRDQIDATLAHTDHTLPPLPEPTNHTMLRVTTTNPYHPVPDTVPFASKLNAQSWLAHKYRIYSDMKAVALSAWKEADDALTEAVTWKQSLLANRVPRRANEYQAWLGYAQMANDLHTDAQRHMHATTTYYRKLKAHDERYQDRFGVDPTPSHLAAYEDEDREESRITRLDPCSHAREHPNETTFICPVCRSTTTTSYPDTTCMNWDCSRYAEPMMTLASFTQLIRSNHLEHDGIGLERHEYQQSHSYQARQQAEAAHATRMAQLHYYRTHRSPRFTNLLNRAHAKLKHHSQTASDAG